MKDTPFLDFYERCMELGAKMPYNGLCICFSDYYCIGYIDLFAPTLEDRHEYRNEIFDDTNRDLDSPLGYYWGSESKESPSNYVFTETRQNVILLCAALNGELD
jgi:hypothetical protein